MPQTAYIAGAMTGQPLLNFPAFDYAAAQWRDAGYEVISPVELTREYWLEKYKTVFDPAAVSTDWSMPDTRELMRRDIRGLLRADVMAVLPGWENSRGVKVELLLTQLLDIPLKHAQTFEPLEVGQLTVLLPSSTVQESILEEAQRLVRGPRQADYKHPYFDYRATGRMWGGMIEKWLHSQGNNIEFPDLPPHLCTIMMAAMKLSREVGKPKRDNRVDTCGYTECADMVLDYESKLLPETH